MKQSNLSSSLAEADQSVKDFMASLYETFSSQIKQENEPSVRLEFFGGVLEVRLLSFDGVYNHKSRKS
ncbi:hypothetical protein [Vibrio spartinae]|uniref:Uncharacterized protein n=1 Tax=Vibrio spartinae TaxID=1918945 RepID=A0A1N6M9H5_9VIBR|nr:hypothetical protein [Vibrio spartinae]SIO96084.1 hypothetical protein VSP9026_03844 [Vibrio spartinae]